MQPLAMHVHTHAQVKREKEKTALEVMAPEGWKARTEVVCIGGGVEER